MNKIVIVVFPEDFQLCNAKCKLHDVMYVVDRCGPTNKWSKVFKSGPWKIHERFYGLPKIPWDEKKNILV